MVARPSNKNRPITGNRHGGNTGGNTGDIGKDDQILALLNRLGTRLIESEKERIIMRKEMAKLSDRTEQSERIFLTLQDRQSKIETRQSAQNEKIEKAAALADRIEETINQQNRLNRRLDKMQGERVQMLRKLERIEETVIETQEALHAKALVLLTDQDVAEDSGKPRLSADTKIAPPATRQDEEDFQTPFWHQPVFLRTAAMTLVAVLAMGGGWAVYKMQQNGGAYTLAAFDDEPAPAAATQRFARNNPPPVADESTARPAYIAEPPYPAQSSAASATMPMPTAATSPENVNADSLVTDERGAEEFAADDPLAPQNILRADDETLLAAMNEDPDRLAAALNNIEPVVGTAQDEVQNATLQQPAEEPVAFTPPAKEPGTPAPAAPAPAPQNAMVSEAQVEEFFRQIRAEKKPLRQALRPDENLPPAIKAFEQKAFDGVPEAQHDLAAIYTAGHSNVQTDYARAAVLFTEAALSGIANARYNLGVLYHQGLGVSRDLPRAINWYRAAAFLGHPEAQYNLGIAHIEGIGTSYNPESAAAYFEAAARSGIMEAAYNLGLIYENGLLGAARPDQALRWYKKAADQGSPEAQAAMNQLAKSMGLSQSDIDAYIFQESGDATPAASAQPVKKSAVESTVAPAATLRPEDKIDVNEIAQYIPQLDSQELDRPRSTQRNANVAMVAQVQDQLMRLGLYPGPADGLNGPQTEDAIRSYQRTHELPADGRVSEALLVHLLTNELNSSLSPAAGGDSLEYGSRAE